MGIIGLVVTSFHLICENYYCMKLRSEEVRLELYSARCQRHDPPNFRRKDGPKAML